LRRLRSPLRPAESTPEVVAPGSPGGVCVAVGSR
jgi:hypothetical protein